ncbi:unnamed protein product [Cunninghamella echinulata]
MAITPSTLLFESGIMKLSNYDPINDRYQLVRTLELPNLPSFEPLDMPLLTDHHPHHPHHHYHEESSKKNHSYQQDHTISRFTECFEMMTPPPPLSIYTSNYSSTLRSTKSVSSKKSIRLIQKPPRRCYSNPNLSKKKALDSSIPDFNQELLSTFKETQSSKQQQQQQEQQQVVRKKSITKALQRLTGLIPNKKSHSLDTNNNHHHHHGNDDDTRSETSTIRQAWVSTTWLDEMKSSMESNHPPQFSDIKRQQTKSWWSMANPISNSNSTSSIPSICV